MLFLKSYGGTFLRSLVLLAFTNKSVSSLFIEDSWISNIYKPVKNYSVSFKCDNSNAIPVALGKLRLTWSKKVSYIYLLRKLGYAVIT